MLSISSYSYILIILQYITILNALYYVVLKIQFASTTFTGSESSGEILVTVLASGATSTSDIDVMINLTDRSAEG